MDKIKAVGVFRETHLAGKPESDALIIRKVGEKLTENGYAVEMREPKDFALDNAHIVFTMARSPESLKSLQELEGKGLFVVNSGFAIAACLDRTATFKKLQAENVPQPETKIMPTSELKGTFESKVVLKKGDTHGKKGDTVIVDNAEDYDTAVESFLAAGTETTLVQQFVDGEDIKFYGVGDKVFLPGSEEKVSQELKEQINDFVPKAANLVGLRVYGGDMILKDGKLYLIDLNEWPSFSAIRDEAADEISQLIIKEYNSQTK
jgi:glutathione synthase/RimK-type ligase-like ATP-grasp enzyme